jgi:hypothetical protein
MINSYSGCGGIHLKKNPAFVDDKPLLIGILRDPYRALGSEKLVCAILGVSHKISKESHVRHFCPDCEMTVPYHVTRYHPIPMVKDAFVVKKEFNDQDPTWLFYGGLDESEIVKINLNPEQVDQILGRIVNGPKVELKSSLKFNVVKFNQNTRNFFVQEINYCEDDGASKWTCLSCKNDPRVGALTMCQDGGTLSLIYDHGTLELI